MQSQLKKSLYLGLAILGLGSVASLSTNASAKSRRSYRDRVTAGAYQTLKTDPTKRNVAATGTNALYNQPGTLKGARVVASKATMAKLASSKSSADYFRAYGVKTTNRGSVYFRVVTMNGKYRGYVYGGKSVSEFAGGIKSANTTTPANLPAQVNNYYLKNVSQNTLWTAPKYTQYGASKVSLYGASKTDKFTVDQAATKTREGSLYYHVVDASNNSVNGWIYAGGLSNTTPAPTATADNSVTVKYVDSSYSPVGSAKTFITAATGTKSGQPLSADVPASGNTPAKTGDLTALNAFAQANVPTGYMVDPTAGKISSATYGSTVQVKVVQAAVSKVAFKTTGNAITNTGTFSAADLNNGAFPSLDAKQQSIFAGQAGQSVFSAENESPVRDFTTDKVFTEGVLHKLVGVTQTAADGSAYHYDYTFDAAATKKANANAKFGDQLQLFYTQTKVDGAAPSTTVNSGNTNYIG